MGFAGWRAGVPAGCRSAVYCLTCWVAGFMAGWLARRHVSPISPVSRSQVHEEKVAASATCQNAACDRLALKIVNFSSYKQRIAGGYCGWCWVAKHVGG